MADTEVDDTADTEWQQLAAQPLRPAERTQLLSRLPAQEASAAGAACAAANEADAKALASALEAGASTAGLLLRPLDKKAEKAALAAHQEGLRVALEGESDPAIALSLVVTLLVAQVCTDTWTVLFTSNVTTHIDDWQGGERAREGDRAAAGPAQTAGWRGRARHACQVPRWRGGVAQG